MGRRINLLPPSERPRTTTDFAALGLVVFVIVVLFGLALGYFFLSTTLDDRQRELADLEQETLKLEREAAELDQYDALASRRAKAEDLAKKLYAGRTVVFDILDEISLVVPERVWFSSLELTVAEPGGGQDARGGQQSTLTVEGKTFDFEDVAELLVRLQLVPSFSSVVLRDAALEDEASGVKAVSVEAQVINTQSPDVPLPVSSIEVGGL
ncbi:MAG: PilN domain-containing protein [Thermoleophilia bacterium]|nr:PilN domain-containing protein [Thermoleophilia bacterium]